MYYLLNQTNQIIAADEGLLSLCGVSHIDELSSKIILGDTIFDLTEEALTIDKSQSFAMSKTSLSSMLGDLTLVTLSSEEKKEENTDLLNLSEDNFLQELDLDEVPEKEETETIDLDSDLSFIKEDAQPDENFLMPEQSVEETLDDGEEILIDIDTISQDMGISQEDYNTFLDEYIDTALTLESDLKSDDTATFNNAINTISQLGDVLRLPMVNTIISKLPGTAKASQNELITSFYTMLSRLTTHVSSSEKVIEEASESPLELFDMPMMKEEVSESTEKKTTSTETSFGSINLEGIKPIHFDFQLEEAANDLSLPVELIEEFVNDFIEQAHIETKKMLEAYEEGDLDAIQKIGHLLKGASSNLRINALSDTLYQIQFCEDPSNLEAYIKEYWGHFLSFEIQIHALAK